jgi:hypothetical protein
MRWDETKWMKWNERCEMRDEEWKVIWNELTWDEKKRKEWNGMEWIEMNWNGKRWKERQGKIEWNEVEWSDVKWNDVRWNNMKLNDMKWMDEWMRWWPVLKGFDRRKFWSQTSDNMDRWKSRGEKSQRRERVRRTKMQVREKVEKSRNILFFNFSTDFWLRRLEK